MKDRKVSGEYYTPEYVISLFVKLSKNLSAKRLLDPACGGAHLLKSVFEGLDGQVEATGVEINSNLFSMAKNEKELSKVRLINADFFSLSQEQLGFFDLIVCNPPFGQGISKQYEALSLRSIESAFILSSMSFLTQGGYVITIIPEGLLFNESSAAFRKYAMENYSLEAVIALPVNIFETAHIMTRILVLKKAKQREQVFFAEYLEQGSLSPIVQNYTGGFSNQNLSQGFWIDADEVKRRNDWSYSTFRGAIDFESLRRNAVYPPIPLCDLVEVDNKGKENENAILIPKAGDRLSIILKSELPESKNLRNYFQCFLKSDSVVLPYIKIYLNSEIGTRQLRYLTTGSSMPSLSRRSLESVFVEVPDIATQVEIIKTQQELRALTTRLQGLSQKFETNPFHHANILSLTENFDKADKKELSFENLLWPLATSYRIATKGSPDLTSQLKSYFKMFEMLTAFNSIVLLSALPNEWRSKYDSDIWSMEKPKYEKISFGSWVALYRRLSNLFLELSKKEKDYHSVLPFAKQDFYQILINPKILRIINLIPEKRNIYDGHGGMVPEIKLKSIISELYPLLNTVFELLQPYSSFWLIYPQSMKKNNGLYNIRIKKLEGTHYPFSEEDIHSEIDMDTEALYLYDPQSQARIKLLPELIKLIQCEHCGHWSVYFFSKVDKDKARYVSYQNEMHDYSGQREGLITSFRKA